MTPSGLFRAFLIAAATCLTAFLLVAALPDERLQFLERLPAKRLLGCGLALNACFVVVAAYHLIVLPIPPRMTAAQLLYIVPLFTLAIVTSAGRPEDIKIEPHPTGWLPSVTMKFGGLDGWSVAMSALLMLFIGVLVHLYANQYYRHYGEPTAHHC